MILNHFDLFQAGIVYGQTGVTCAVHVLKGCFFFDLEKYYTLSTQFGSRKNQFSLMDGLTFRWTKYNMGDGFVWTTQNVHAELFLIPSSPGNNSTLLIFCIQNMRITKWLTTFACFVNLNANLAA